MKGVPHLCRFGTTCVAPYPCPLVVGTVGRTVGKGPKSQIRKEKKKKSEENKGLPIPLQPTIGVEPIKIVETPPDPMITQSSLEPNGLPFMESSGGVAFHMLTLNPSLVPPSNPKHRSCVVDVRLLTSPWAAPVCHHASASPSLVHPGEDTSLTD